VSPSNHRPGRWEWLGWSLAVLGLALLVIDRFDLTTVWVHVIGPDGSAVRLANGWSTVDHPFHVTRAQELLNSLRDRHLLRWFGQHQGGYPAEFYPTGAAWLDVVLWTLTAGQLPMAVIHKLLIALIVLAPTLIFMWWAVRDRLSPGVALLAGAGHLVIAGEWWSGGWTEVALWGLVTNVAAQTAILASLAGVLGWLKDGNRRDLGISAIAVGLALGSNPRTFIALGAVGIAALVVTLTQSPRIEIRALTRRVLVLGALSFALGAPELVSLLRYQDLYFFVHYSNYADLGAWWDSSAIALWRPIFMLSLIGLALAVIRPNRPVTRTVGLTAAIYMGITAIAVAAGGGLVEQLELTRLMPFQRMLMFYLAALAVYEVIEAVQRLVRVRSPQATSVMLALTALVLIWVVVIRPASWVPVEQRGLRAVPSSAQPAMADLEAAVHIADDSAPPGTAILILGSALSWHQQLYAPGWSDRRFFYDDWLWYWQQDHVGPYNPETEHAYPVDTATLTEAYLTTHGIGAVVVTDAVRQENRSIAAQSPLLTLVSRGETYDVFTVNTPVPIVTAGAAPADSMSITDRSIRASGTSDGAPIIVRHNWFPRWHATLNGEAAVVEKLDNGYMAIAAPPGPYELELRYVVTWTDWFARALFVIGAIAAVALLTGIRRPKRDAAPLESGAASQTVVTG
jgi:hypothetical protein